MPASSSSVVLRDLSFAWPEGTLVLDQVSGVFGPGRTALIGTNGVGKTTLLRLVAGLLAPTSGSVVSSGTLDYLPQDVARRATRTIADLLGITPIRRALRAVESGSTDPVNFDVVGTDWDIEDRAVAGLRALGIPGDLDRASSSLSGGEAMLAAIGGVQLRGADIALLDEPTNNLDVDARRRLYDVVAGWRGALVVVSHDLELLDLVDETTELRDRALTTFGGPYRELRRWRAAQQDAAAQALRTAEQTLRRERRERAKAEQRIAHSARQGRKDAANRKYIGLVVDNRRNSAEKAQGVRRSIASAKVSAAREAVAAAEVAVRTDDRISVDLPDPRLPGGRRVAELVGPGGGGYVLCGPERVGIVGPNGVGKTALLERLLPNVAVRVGYLPQRILLDDAATVLDVVAGAAPTVPRPELRNRLARLLIRGAMVDRPAATLSGGERFRVAVARLLLADPPNELLVLDEPTNDLDLASRERLTEALAGYRGALLVVSHDRPFLAGLGLHARLHLGRDGRLVLISAA